MKITYLLLSILFVPFLLPAQEDVDASLKYEDYVYMDNIHSVQWNNGGYVRSYPIVRLHSGERLILSFDVLDEEEVLNFVYTIVHCDYNWQPSNLSDMDYTDGFNEDDIDDYDFSFNTYTNYTHYELALPNSDFSWTLSGNYLLKVYDNSDEKKLAITRRFVVVDPLVNIRGQLRRPAKVSLSRTHQELDFSIDIKDLPTRNPRSDIKVVVLQNGRWDTAIKDIPPMFVRPDELIYDHQDKIIFPAGKEFRSVDIRTFKSSTNSVYEIIKSYNQYDIVLRKDSSRQFISYLFYNDLNGKFVIQSFEERDGDLRGDYAHVLFTLDESPAFEDHDVYIYGGLTDWRLQDKFKTVYNPLIGAYVGKVFLKQGFYDYIYVLADKKTKEIDSTEFEGNWYETENDYTVIVYYQPFGARYAAVIGVQHFNWVR